MYLGFIVTSVYGLHLFYNKLSILKSETASVYAASLLRLRFSSLRCVRTHRPRRFFSLFQLADIKGFQQVGLTN